MDEALQKLKRTWSNLADHPFPGFGHGEIMAHPELMAQEIRCCSFRGIQGRDYPCYEGNKRHVYPWYDQIDGREEDVIPGIGMIPKLAMDGNVQKVYDGGL